MQDQTGYRPLKIDKKFIPCPVDEDDELYPNGIFVFNITRMLAAIVNEPGKFEIGDISVGNFCRNPSRLNEAHLETVDLARPVLLAEIAPGQYNLIDGHHRLEKARRLRLVSLPAYKLTVRQRISFLVGHEAYLDYVRYWNEKCRARTRYAKMAQKCVP